MPEGNPQGYNFVDRRHLFANSGKTEGGTITPHDGPFPNPMGPGGSLYRGVGNQSGGVGNQQSQGFGAIQGPQAYQPYNNNLMQTRMNQVMARMPNIDDFIERNVSHGVSVGPGHLEAAQGQYSNALAGLAGQASQIPLQMFDANERAALGAEKAAVDAYLGNQANILCGQRLGISAMNSLMNPLLSALSSAQGNLLQNIFGGAFG